MQFTSKQDAILSNLYKHAERKTHDSAYRKYCFDHLLGIYLEFGSYRNFDLSIEPFLEYSVRRFKDFSIEMVSLGLSNDDHRLPEIIPYIGRELRSQPNGSLSTVLSNETSSQKSWKIPEIKTKDGSYRFSPDDYWLVYGKALDAKILNAAADPLELKRWSESLSDYQDFLGDRLYPTIVKLWAMILPYDHEFRVKMMASEISHEEVAVSFRSLIEQTNWGSGFWQNSDDEFETKLEIFTNLIDVCQAQGGFSGSMLDGFLSDLLDEDAGIKNGESLSLAVRKVSIEIRTSRLIATCKVLRDRSIPYAYRLGELCLYKLRMDEIKSATSFDWRKQNAGSNKSLAAEWAAADKAIHDVSALEADENPNVMFASLCGALPFFHKALPALSALVRHLLTETPPEIKQAAALVEYQAYGYYLATGDKRYLPNISSRHLREEMLGYDLGL